MKTDNYLAEDFRDIPTADADCPARLLQAAWQRHHHLCYLHGLVVGPGGRAATGRARQFAYGFQCVPADWRGRAGDRLYGQDRDGAGTYHLPAADAGRGIGCAARIREDGHGRHRPVSLGHGHVRVADDPQFRAGPASRCRRGKGGASGVGCGKARSACEPARGQGWRDHRQARRQAAAHLRPIGQGPED